MFNRLCNQQLTQPWSQPRNRTRCVHFSWVRLMDSATECMVSTLTIWCSSPPSWTSWIFRVKRLVCQSVTCHNISSWFFGPFVVASTTHGLRHEQIHQPQILLNWQPTLMGWWANRLVGNPGVPTCFNHQVSQVDFPFWDPGTVKKTRTVLRQRDRAVSETLPVSDGSCDGFFRWSPGTLYLKGMVLPPLTSFKVSTRFWFPILEHYCATVSNQQNPPLTMMHHD